MTVWHRIRQVRAAPSLLRLDNLFHRYVTYQVLAPTWVGFVLRLLLTVLVGLAVGAGVIFATSLSRTYMMMLIGIMIVPFAVMVVNNLRMLLLGLLVFEMAIALDSNLNYQFGPAESGAIGGLNISLSTVALIALYFFWIAQLLSQRGVLAHQLPRFSIAHVAFFSFTVFSMLRAYDPELSLNEVILYFYALLIHIYVFSTFTRRSELEFMVVMMMIATSIQALLMIAVFVLRRDIDVGPLFVRFDSSTSRVGGTVGAPNGAAMYLVMMLPASVLSMAAMPRRWHKLLGAASFVLGVIALFTTQSRGGLISFVITMTILSLMSAARGWMKLKWPLVVAYLGAIPMVMLAPILLARFFEDDGGSAESRGPLNQLALRIIEDYPILGVGINNFAVVKNEYITPEFGGVWLSTVHNHYLRVWSEMGVVGLGLYIAMVIAIIAVGLRCWHIRHIDPFLGMLAISLSAGILGVQFQIAFDLFNGRAQIHTMWLVSAMIMAAYKMAVQQRRERMQAEADLPATAPTAPQGARGL